RPKKSVTGWDSSRRGRWWPRARSPSCALSPARPACAARSFRWSRSAIMRLEIVKIVFLKELRETLRDRRSMVIMFGIPILLYPLLMLGAAGLGASKVQRLTQKVARVAVVNGTAAPHLLSLIQAQNSGLRIIPTTDPKAALTVDRIDAFIVVPPDAEQAAL